MPEMVINITGISFCGEFRAVQMAIRKQRVRFRIARDSEET